MLLPVNFGINFLVIRYDSVEKTNNFNSVIHRSFSKQHNIYFREKKRSQTTFFSFSVLDLYLLSKTSILLIGNINILCRKKGKLNYLKYKSFFIANRVYF